MVERVRARRRLASLLGSLLLTAGLLPVIVAPVAAATPVFINEIHYDDEGEDIGEAIEIAGPAGTDITGWSLALYNGADGQLYGLPSAVFSGTIQDAGSGFGTAAVFYGVNGIQNGDPDGIALVDASNTVVQFLSYEGSFTAANGPAAGMVSTDIGVAEGSSTPAGTSLSLVGTGTTYENFSWQAGVDDSFGNPNLGQTFGDFDATSVINEFSASTAGIDVEYVEVFGTPDTDLSTLTILEIEGDAGTTTGTVDEVVTLGTTGPNGLYLANLPANALENGTITLLLVRGFTGAMSSDLDVDNDGTFDTTPWAAIVDAVAVNDGGAGDLTYGTPSLGVAYDGMAFAPGGASRIPDGVDTGTTADWLRNDFDLAGIGSTAGTRQVGEAVNTPGALNVKATPLVINEVDYDQPDMDAAEFIELKNITAGDLSLAGFSVELVNGNAGGAVVYDTVTLPAVSLPAGEYFVICANAATVTGCDLDDGPETNFIQNGSPDAVSLRLGGRLADTVSYEGNTGAPHREGSGADLVDDAGGTTSIGRCADGADTDQNNEDFLLRPATPGAANNCPLADIPLGECGDTATLVHAIQGSSATSDIAGTQVVVEGIVVGDFQNNAGPDSGNLNGFYVQEEDAQADLDPATSEGILAFAPGAADVTTGDKVRVRGTVTEFTTSGGASMTELSAVNGLLLCAPANPLPTAASVTLPVSALSDFERYEGMRLALPQALVISEFFNYDRFGEVVLALPLDGETRPFTGTAIDEPGAAANARTLANSLRRITLDDGLTAENPEVTRHPNGSPFSLTNRFRGGDTVQNVVGVLDHTSGVYRVQPTGPAEYAETNPRPAAPSPVGGSLRAAAMNTLNYFLTADYPSGDPLDNKCGPAENQECRGWDFDQPDEFSRQRAKLLQALGGLGAHVIGLNELENRPGVNPSGDIAAGLTSLGFGSYAAINTGTIGTDAIRVGLIYRTDVVTPVGAHQILDSTDDPRFIDTKSRPVLAQTFEVIATGARFTVAVNHLKSKGSDCDDVGDPDTGDGQGNCNQTRLAAAQALVDWLATDPTGSGDRDFLILGDLNSYAKEDPIDAIKAGPDDVPGTADDYTNLVAKYGGTHAYSYTFDGQSGYLDHALGSPTLTAQVTGVTEWHINADEPDLLDYDTTFKSPGQDAIYAADQYRTSDHDPVIVGLELLAYEFGGFQAPVDAPPTVNTVKAGASVPVSFTLGGNEGLGIFFNSPTVTMFDCAAGEPTDAIETVNPGGSGLRYDAATDTYIYVWKTDKSWANSCRILQLAFDDGTWFQAKFSFRP